MGISVSRRQNSLHHNHATITIMKEREMSQATVGRWGRFEAIVRNPTNYANAYTDVTLDVVYTRPDGSTVSFWGFYDGDDQQPDTWRIRFMPDQTGEWRYRAAFSDGTVEAEGAFTCVESDIPGPLGPDASNPMWFGFRSGEKVLIRSFHVGDGFFSSNLPPERRTSFLDWAQSQGYNMLSIASHYLNRAEPGRGEGWDTPRLWPLNAGEYRRMEAILDELTQRRILVFPFAGFFGRASNFPIDPAEQDQYLRYTLARIAPYWNITLNVSGPEPLLAKKPIPHMGREEVCRLGARIQELNVFGHALTVHNATGDDAFKDEPWLTFGTLQGPKTTDLPTLSAGAVRNHHGAKPLYIQETLWSGNKYHPNYTDEQLRKNAYVLLMAGGAINFIDNGGPVPDAVGDSSSGFSGSLDLADRRQGRHDILKHVWDTFAQFPFQSLRPAQELVSRGYCLADPGNAYLVYVDNQGTLDVAIEAGSFAVEWINAQDCHDRHNGGVTTTGKELATPGRGDDWLLYLQRKP